MTDIEEICELVARLMNYDLCNDKDTDRAAVVLQEQAIELAALRGAHRAMAVALGLRDDWDLEKLIREATNGA